MTIICVKNYNESKSNLLLWYHFLFLIKRLCCVFKVPYKLSTRNRFLWKVKHSCLLWINQAGNVKQLSHFAYIYLPFFFFCGCGVQITYTLHTTGRGPAIARCHAAHQKPIAAEHAQASWAPVCSASCSITLPPTSDGCGHHSFYYCLRYISITETRIDFEAQTSRWLKLWGNCRVSQNTFGNRVRSGSWYSPDKPAKLINV